ncbi:TetR/AcrR family transcriptional regulator [Leucobacter sp. W1478]|uniref:TetR/AcrR family transcriptional regulator n=1 Tax=Leucobacter sp. W1478 TaxID=3439065 RepID=UPI003F2AA061
MTAPTRRSGRPRSAVLTRELIMRTALRLLDERGEHGAGIREIARELGVRPSALYNHVTGQDDIVGGVRELVSDRIDVSMFDELPWYEALRLWAVSYRNAFAAHPPTIALLAVRPLEPGLRTNHMYDRVCAGLITAGWPLERVLTVVVELESFVLGSALDEAAPDDMLDPGVGEGLPHFRAAYAARARDLQTRGLSASELAFRSGLEAMLTGLRAEWEAYSSVRSEIEG